MKKTIALLTILALLLTGLALAGAEEETPDAASRKAQDTPSPTPASISFGGFITRLTSAFEIGKHADEDVQALDSETARSVAEHWRKVYLNPDYHLYLYGTDDPSLLPITGAHAFAVPGYQLENGEMTGELRGRCDAAAAAARAFPASILVCSGGATGDNNPEGHTEAGLMRDYLTGQCGIAPERVFIDELAMDTAENAVNTLEILRAHGVETMTIVTSAYHQRRCLALYHAAAAQCREKYGYSVEIVGNFCLNVTSDNPLYR